MSEHYILDGHTPKPCDLITWAKWFETADRHVGQKEQNAVKVSTVFLGLDYEIRADQSELFETMVFGGEHDGNCVRYATWDEAERGHRQMCVRVFGPEAEVEGKQ